MAERFPDPPMWFAVDRDGFPIWLAPVSRARAAQLAREDDCAETYRLLDAARFNLMWGVRHGIGPRWWVIPRDEFIRECNRGREVRNGSYR